MKIDALSNMSIGKRVDSTQDSCKQNRVQMGDRNRQNWLWIYRKAIQGLVGAAYATLCSLISGFLSAKLVSNKLEIFMINNI